MSDVRSLVESVCKPGLNVEDLRRLLLTFNDQLELHNAATGTNWLNPTSTTQKAQSLPPAKASASVSGANGNVQLQLTNPTQGANATVYHEVSYSTVKNFSQNVTTLPVSAATSFNIPAPGQQLFVRYRSSFDGSTWNSHALASNSAVDAGLQSSAATEAATVLNQSNYANVDSIASGATAVVRIYGTSGPYNSYVAIKGAQQLTRPSATIINVPYDSTQVVSYDGSQFHLSPILPGALADAHEPVGVVNVVGSGTPTLPTIVPIISAGYVVGFSVTSGGAGATAPYTLAFGSVGGGAGATFGAQTIVGGVLIAVAPGNAGNGMYSGGTTVTATGGGVNPGTPGGGTATGGNGARLTAAAL